MEKSSNLSDEVKRLRTAADLSQAELGKRIGVNQSFVQKLESGERGRLGADVYLRLCDALGVECDHFRPYLAPDDVTPTAPVERPKRGRPPKNK